MASNKVPQKEFLTDLPIELAVKVVDRYLPGLDISVLPRVCKRWKRMFETGTPYEDAFRAATRRRFNISKKPRYARKKGWGRLYVHLRSEMCHECSNGEARPGLFTANPFLMFSLPSGESLYTLFPVCAQCYHSDGFSTWGGSFVKAIDPDMISQKFAYPDAPVHSYKDVDRKYAVLYTNIGRLKNVQSHSKYGIEILLRRDIEDAFPKLVSEDKNAEE